MTDDRLADLLERWEEARGALTPDDLCRDTPDDLPAFRALIDRLGAAGLVSGDGTVTRDPLLAAGFRAGRYRALGYHAEGGLGIIYRAHDEELNREVALKVMKSRGLGADRFAAEAEVTSRLEHPGIVPVYGRGTADPGPYYAMRFVAGETLQAAADRSHAGNGELRPLVRAVGLVCEAVAYAHARGVLHRDLKPANVMLGPYGEVLVMDWGLARAADAPADEPGRAKGSPAFMSPEQASGHWDRVGPAADVYSLGATLYYVLAGRPPYEGDSGREVISKVIAGHFPPPRTVNPTAPGSLNAVCLKAMAPDPADRYPDAKALAADLDRWLADEPVTAWQEPLPMRARRWAQRHRTAVVAAAAALVVGVAVLGITGYRLDQKNTDLREANEREVALRARAEAGEKAALERKALADERFTLAVDALRTFTTEVQDKLSTRAATRDLRESLLQTAATKLAKLAANAEESGEADASAVDARLALGEVYRRADLNADRAAAEYTKAREIAVRLVEATPGEPDLELRLADCDERLGDVALMNGQAGEARRHFQAAFDRREKLPDSAKVRSARADSHAKLGQALRRLLDLPAAIKHFEEALRLTERLSADAPADRNAERSVGVSHLALADALRDAERPADSRAAAREALRVFEAVSAKDPNAELYKSDVASTHQRIAVALNMLGKPADAVAAARTGLELRKKLVAADPRRTDLQLALAQIHNHLSQYLSARGDEAEALAEAKAAHAITGELLAAAPKDHAARHQHYLTTFNLAKVPFFAGRHGEAVPGLLEARGMIAEIVAATPGNLMNLLDLAGCEQQLGHAYAVLKADRPAAEHMAASQKIWLEVTAKDPANPKYPLEAMNAARTLASLLITAKDWAGAEAALDRAAPTAEQYALDPALPQYTADSVARYHAIRGDVLVGRKRPAAGVTAYETAVAFHRIVEAAVPDKAQTWMDSVGVTASLAQGRRAAGEFAGEAAAWGEALRAITELGRVAPEDKRLGPMRRFCAGERARARATVGTGAVFGPAFVFAAKVLSKK
jgi:eukaryotic-like serine/threonine-protein kinase